MTDPSVEAFDHNDVAQTGPDPYALYASLRALDTQGFDTIVVTLPADTEENAAVRDRLQRAATAALTSTEALRSLRRAAEPKLCSRADLGG